MLSPKEYVVTHLNRLNSYITGITSTTITAGKYERLAVQRFLDFKDKYSYRESELMRVLKFCSLLNLTTTKEVKQLELMDFQVFILANLYGLYLGNSTRVFNTGIIECGKKQGKSSLAAVLCLYESVADKELNASVLLIAKNSKQAKTVFNYIESIITVSPLIKDLFTINRSIIYNSSTTGKNKIEVIPADPRTVQGNNCSFSIADEAAQYTDREMQAQANIFTGMASRVNPLQLIITTASNNKAAPYYDKHQTVKNILDNKGTPNDNVFGIIFSLDDKEEIYQPDKWRKSNPGIGQTVSQDFLLSAYDKAILTKGIDWQSFLTDNLNLFTDNLIENWIDDETIKGLLGRKSIPTGSTVYIGLDLSAQRDLTSIAILFYDKKADEFIVEVIPIFPNGSENRIKSGSVDLSRWFGTYDEVLFGDKNIVQCQGSTLDEEIVIQIFERLNKTYRIERVGADPWNSRLLLDRLNYNFAVNVDEVRQNVQTLSFPLRMVEKYLCTGKMFLPNNLCLRWQFQNVKLYVDVNNNIKLNKIRGEAIDSIVAINIAMHQFLKANSDDLNFRREFDNLKPAA